MQEGGWPGPAGACMMEPMTSGGRQGISLNAVPILLGDLKEN